MQRTLIHLMKKIFPVVVFLLLNSIIFAQSQGIKGKISDKKTHETLVGASVVIQGTVTGASTDLDGNFTITQLQPGTYNVVVSYISYKTQVLEKVKVTKGEWTVVEVELEENASNLEGVEIKAVRRTGSDISILNSIKKGNIVANGISSQLISRSPDRDASEVIKRIPGITIANDRFVVVRGLSQRYNTVWLNNITTPSSEPDVRAFSFDMIPSSMLDNMMVFKSPAPELPADFSGAAIKIFTKNNAENNNLIISYSTAYRPDVTGKTFESYKTGKYDWLGFDDGSRSLPADFPSNVREVEEKPEIQRLGRELNKVWTATPTTAIPDQRFQIASANRFTLGKISIGTINNINFSMTQDISEVYRADYQTYDTLLDHSDTSYFFNDLRYKSTSKLGALSNWTFIFGNNQKIEFRNLYNHIGATQTISRSGRDNYGGLTIKSYELGFNSRNTYSGQLAGNFTFNDSKSSLDATIGYSYADRYQPDQKRLTTILVEDPESQYFGKYGVNFSFAATPELSGRVFQNLTENILSFNSNYSTTLSFGEFKPEVKAGVFIEKKQRNFSARNLGYAISNFMYFDWSLPYQSIDSIFADTNINSKSGIKIDETTNKSDSYTASNGLIASYIAFKLPFTSKLSLYTGVRNEVTRQQLNSFSSDNASDTINVDLKEFRFFPSANLSYNFTDKTLLRSSYGVTINRPEFREVAPFAFYDFELKKLIRGNPDLVNAIIHNYDLRFEHYPSPNEIVSFSIFYKNFIHPIEIVEINSGSGKDYTFQNALGASSYGVEFEIRKSFESFGKKIAFMKNFRNLMLITNVSLIKSEIRLDTAINYATTSVRAMQGQSPFIVNCGLFYQSEKLGFTASALFNIIGKRIVTVGLDLPDVYEMPRHQIDLQITKNIGKMIQLKFGIQDLLNQYFTEQQFVKFNLSGKGEQMREQYTLHYKPGSIYNAGITFNFNSK